MNDIITLQRVCKKVHGCTLENINLHVYDGCINTVLSNSDIQCEALCGLLCGEYPPDDGIILLDGEKCEGYNKQTAQDAGICRVFSNSHLFLRNSIAENLFVLGRSGISVRPLRIAEQERKTNSLLRELGLEGIFSANRHPFNYSEGLCHILEILRAVAQEARLIVCENIFEYMTAEETEHTLRVLERVRRRGISVLLFMTRYAKAIGISDRITILRNGTTIFNLRHEDISPDSLRYALSGGIIETENPILPQLERSVRTLSLQEIRNEWSLKSVSFTLFAGERLGIFDAEMHAGRELIDVLCHGDACEGRVEYGNKTYALNPKHHFPSNLIFHIAENAPGSDIFPNMSLYDNITLAIPRKLQHPLSNTANRIRRYMYAAALRKIGSEELNQHIPERSNLYGISVTTRLKVLFARCICAQAKIILLEDTHTNRSPEYNNDLRFLLNHVASAGISVVLLSNDMPFLQRNCDRVLCLENGAITGQIRA